MIDQQPLQIGQRLYVRNRVFPERLEYVGAFVAFECSWITTSMSRFFHAPNRINRELLVGKLGRSTV